MTTRDECLLGTLERIVLLAVMCLGVDAYGTTIRDPTAERGGRAKRFFQVSAEGRPAVRRSQDAIAAMTDGFRVARGRA